MNLGYHRDSKKLVPLKNERRFSNTHLIGKKQTGKTTAIINYVLQDIENGERAVFIDLNGSAIDEILLRVPEHRADDITFLDFADTAFPPGLNLFHNIPRERHARVAGALVDIARAIWDYGSQPTPRLNLYLRAAARVMLDVPNGTLLGLYYLLTSDKHRSIYLPRIKDTIIKDIWEAFGAKKPKEQGELIDSTLTRIFEIVSDPMVRNIVGQYRTSFDLKDTKVLLAAIPESVLGRDISRMLGCILLALIQLDAQPFHVHLDNADRFAPSQLIAMLDSAGSLTLSHRYLDQLDDDLRYALLDTAGTLVWLQIGPKDVNDIKPLLAFAGRAELGLNQNSLYSNLTDLPPRRAYARTDRAILLTMSPLPAPTDPKIAKSIRDRCRSQYGGRREHVEREIEAFVAG